MSRLAVLGPPGSEHTAVVERIAARLGVPALCVLDAFHAQAHARTAAAAEVQRLIRAGQLIPDEVTLRMVLPHLDRHGFVLDGFPRTEVQARMLTAGLAGDGMSLDRVVALELPDAEAVRRLIGRRVCGGCGRIWHVELDPPAVEGRCDRCGDGLFHREDDSWSSLTEALRRYRSDTGPTLAYYQSSGLLVTIDATLTPEQIVQEALC